MTIILQNVRASFPRIVEPEINKSFPNTPPKYSMNLIIPKDHPGMAEFMKSVQALAVDKWKEHAGTILQMANGNKKLRCYGAGEEVMNSTTFEVYKGYPGMLYISAGSDKDHPPQIIKRDSNGLAQAAHDLERQELAKRIYGGCRVNVAISPWLQDNAGGRAVRCNLLAIEFAGDDEPLGDGGGATNVAGLFGNIPAPVAAPAAAPAAGGMTFPGMPSFLS